MTNYNDGNIHGWNGGECPVHPKTQVECREWSGAWWMAEAENCDWKSIRGAFRVIKEHCEPQLIWIDQDNEVHYFDAADDVDFFKSAGWRLFREVLE